jgi:alkaline phosphatase D
MKTVLGFFLIFGASFALAQNITHGPILGAMTDTSFRMYIRTANLQSFTIEIDSDSLFSAPLQFQNQAQAALDSSVIANINGLTADTRYYYRVLFNSVPDIKKGSFKN